MAKKSLQVLIRLRKWEVDEKQRALGVLIREEENVLYLRRHVEESLARESAFTAKADPLQRSTFEPFVRRCKMQREALQRALDDVRKRIATAQGELGDAYRRLKTFEITQKARDAAAEAEENRLEQIALDDMGLELYRRRAGGAAIS
ncbi:MAG: hypothetical protein FJX59_12230 [Alphaproteobacteria bacterium]|nr:hypothetical protein [Alphaproteobacteria bacterium]